MMLDTKNQLLGEKEITRGTVNATMISPRGFCWRHIRQLRAASYSAGSQPSKRNRGNRSGDEHYRDTGDPAGGEALGIALPDDIIIGDHCYTSMLEQGI